MMRTLRKHCKDWFIPQEANGHHPHILRWRGTALWVFAVVVLQLAFNVTHNAGFGVLGYATNISSPGVLSEMNNERQKQGVKPLRSNAKLRSAAQAKAQDMLAKDYWAHTSPSGVTPWQFIQKAGYTYTHAAENLAKDFDASSGVVAGWMASGSHRANVLSANYTEAGIAVVNGKLDGAETTLVVALYANPVPALPKATQPTTRPATPIPATRPSVKVEPKPVKVRAVVKEEKAPTGPPKTFTVAQPLPPAQTLHWGKLSAVIIMGSVAGVDTLKHTLVWRRRPRRVKGVWFKGQPLLQALLLVAIAVATIASGFGTVL